MNEIDPYLEVGVCAQLWAYVGKSVKDPRIISKIVSYCYDEWLLKPDRLRVLTGAKIMWLKLSAKRIIANYLKNNQ